MMCETVRRSTLSDQLNKIRTKMNHISMQGSVRKFEQESFVGEMKQ